jgi:ATP-binding cassette, subfamily C, bacteriocin exporter
MVGKVKQRDITDCGAACLASVAMHYDMKLPVARIRQMAGTDKKGTNVLGMVEAAGKMGFTAKGVRGEWESLFKIPLPAIAHIIVKERLHHFVVISKVTKDYIEVMDPGDGQLKRKSHEEFKKEWTGVLILLLPGDNFVTTDQTTSAGKRFWSLLYPHKAIIAQALVGAIIFAILGLASAVYLGKIVDHVLPAGNVNLLNLLGVAMVIVIVFRMLLNTFQMQFVLKTGQKIDATLILGYYKHILKLPQTFFDTMRVGEIISRLNDAVKVSVFINDIAINLVVNILILIVSFALMFTYYWKLAIVMLIVIPLYALIYGIANRLNKKVQRKVMERAADLESQLVESLNSASTIKHFNLEGFSNLKTETRFTSLLGEIYKSGLNNIFSKNSTSFITQGFTVVLLWVGATFALQNQITPGELLSFYAVLGYFTGPVSGIIGFNQSLQDAMIASDRLFEIFDLQREDSSGQNELKPENIGDIHFKDVSFRYGTRVQVFEKLNLTLESGKVTAIVGESGCGKTTIASILQKMYPLQSGNIYLGERNMNLFTHESLRRIIAIVPQRVDLFSGNVIDNIAVGEFYPDMDRLVNVCNQLGITPFIEQLPNGFQTYLGENGASLSGGQKQRIAIARALYREPEILILDEATSSLDSVAEGFVQKTISLLREQGKTIIIIAHRFSTIVNADKVIVLDQGKVIQEGSVRELSEEEGKFKEMFIKNHLIEQPE